MTFIGYEIGSKAYKFMQKNTSIFIAAHAWFDEEKFPKAKSEDGSSKNKLNICPPDINQDQEDINNSTIPNSDTDSDHNHDDPHDDSSSDDTPSNKQEKSQSEEEHFESVDKEDSEDEVESNLKPKTESSDDEESSDGHSRGSSTHSSK